MRQILIALLLTTSFFSQSALAGAYEAGHMLGASDAQLAAFKKCRRGLEREGVASDEAFERCKHLLSEAPEASGTEAKEGAATSEQEGTRKAYEPKDFEALFPGLRGLLKSVALVDSNGAYVAGSRGAAVATLTLGALALARAAILAITKNPSLAAAFVPVGANQLRFDFASSGVSLDEARAFFRLSSAQQDLACRGPAYALLCADLQKLEEEVSNLAAPQL